MLKHVNINYIITVARRESTKPDHIHSFCVLFCWGSLLTQHSDFQPIAAAVAQIVHNVILTRNN